MTAEPISRYPLQWPAGWPRTESYRRQRAKFTARGAPLSIAESIGRVLDELRRMSVRSDDIVVSTNVQTRLDGLPRSDQANPSDPGVAVYWIKRGGATKVMAVDRYDRVADNVAAIAATLDAMRAIERHGGAVILDRAFAGFDALPAPGSRGWRQVFGFHPAARVTVDEVTHAYRRLAGERHPDKGGTDALMSELNAARDAALREAAR